SHPESVLALQLRSEQPDVRIVLSYHAWSILWVSSRTAISRSRTRPSRMASSSANISYNLGSFIADSGTLRCNGRKEMPRTEPLAYGHTGGGSVLCTISLSKGGAA